MLLSVQPLKCSLKTFSMLSECICVHVGLRSGWVGDRNSMSALRVELHASEMEEEPIETQAQE